MSQESNNVVAMPGPNATAVRIQETGVLLERPTYHGLPRHDFVYGFVGGRVGTAPLARYRLPASLRGGTLVAPGPTDDDGLAILPELARIADRIAPWIAVHVVPRILTRREADGDFERGAGHYEVGGTPYSSAGGLACYTERLVLLQCSSPTWMAHSLLHELFHHLWRSHISGAARDVMTTAVEGGAAWPGRYFDSVSERTARLFESWGWARMEGMPCADPVPMTVEGIFEFVWSGGLADHQIQLGLVPGAEALCIRRGLRMLPPEPEVVEVEAEANEDDTDSMIALLGELASATSRAVVRAAKWAWHGSAAAA